MINKSFWWGVGSAGLAWLFRREFRNAAVQGTKKVLLVKKSLTDVVEEAQAKNALRDN
ncbi:hypothetical protein [Desulfitibacter alkalitolerans]|uniref:hypothetical protein n=1 Tax=Desulfitibacter alkalitolerans TaxID=264641 RepID=UPI0012EB1177|nr:hypothetical protein [Desulfitibacter alkalitolerans]